VSCTSLEIRCKPSPRLAFGAGEKQRLTRTEIYGENPSKPFSSHLFSFAEGELFRRRRRGLCCFAYPGYPCTCSPSARETRRSPSPCTEGAQAVCARLRREELGASLLFRRRRTLSRESALSLGRLRRRRCTGALSREIRCKPTAKSKRALEIF